MTTLASARLRLRVPTVADLDAITKMNADPQVMEHFPQLLNAAQSESFLHKVLDRFAMQDFGFWLVECPESHKFLGMCGLNRIDFEVPGVPQGAVEIMWRLPHAAWGNLVATEAAAAVLDYAFSTLHLPQVFAFTALSNHRSESVMQRIGMQKVGLFEHPKLPKASPLSTHVLYSIHTQ